MKQVRLSIDLIDSKILPLMVKRSKLVNKALDLKSKRNEIIDKKRIDQILKKIGINSKKLFGFFPLNRGNSPIEKISVIPKGSIKDLGNSGSVSAFHKKGKAFSPAFIYFFSK